MPVYYLYLLAATGAAGLLRQWQGGHAPQGAESARDPVRFLAAGFPLCLFLWMGFSEGHRFWFFLPRVILASGVSWVFLTLWGLGILVRNLILLAGAAVADRRLVAHAWRIDLTRLGITPGLAPQAGLRRLPPILASLDIGQPMVVGAFRPHILLPMDWIPVEDLGLPAGIQPTPPSPVTPEALTQALAHELRHVAHRDLLRRLLGLSLALLIPLEWIPQPLRRDGRPGHRFRALVRRCLGEEWIREEAAANPAPGNPGVPFAHRLRTATALVGMVVLLGLAPGSLNLAFALGGETPIPRLLPRNWTLLQSGAWKGTYGFLPPTADRDACVAIHIKGGTCAMGQTASLPPGLLDTTRRIEFEVEVEALDGPLSPDTHAGFSLQVFHPYEEQTLRSWHGQDLAHVEVDASGNLRQIPEGLGQGRYRFRNALPLDARPGIGRQRIDLEISLAGPGHYRVFAPRLWRVEGDGTRLPLGP